ncbi:orotate phosphoribosyltransferase [Hugenholtzia roseola]|uniref:orotate phosphoribosyltransferase n=1 Tax=Hugenholtzia roseola TaxID=1002 RepID=UPI0003F73AC3|nr:orotate phosphoribosyltransferase [Hugenholtzia roseola]
MTTTEREIAAALLEIGAVKLSPQEPFKWASGWLSPIYCDNRLTLSYPTLRTQIKEALVALLQTHFAQAQAVAGVATAGIPQAALVADALELPLLYVRPAPKSHGTKSQIEGKYEKGQKVVVLEDLISTGKSSLAALEVLRSEGVEVLGMIAIFSYGFPLAKEAFEAANVPFYTLSNYTALLTEALRKEYIQEEELATLQEWRNAPEKWK